MLMNVSFERELAKSDPENVCVGTPTGEGYTFEFAVPSTEEDQKYQVAIRKKEGGVWYQYSKGGEFTITIPGNKAPTPTVTPVPSETPAPAPTATPTPAVKPAGNVCDSGIYNVTVNSSATMFRVVNCVLTDCCPYFKRYRIRLSLSWNKGRSCRSRFLEMGSICSKC